MSCNVLVAGFAFGGAIIPVCGRGDDGELTCCPAGFSCKPNGVGSAVCAIIPDDVESFEPPPPPPPPDNSTFVPGGQDNSTVTPPPADNSTFTPSQGDNSTFVPPPADNSTTSLPPVDNSTSPDGTGFVNSTNVKRDDGSSTDAGVPPRSTFAQVPTAGGVVAGVTVGAFFSAASLTFYFWARWTKKRQAEGEVTETGCRPRLWALLLTRRKASVQVVSDALPYHVAVIPDDKGRPKGADGMSLVELPATPLSFSFWSRRLSRSVKGRSTIQRFSTV